MRVVKRLAKRWMARAGFAYNNAREHFDTSAGRYDTNGNPTPTLAEPLVDGGQFAPQSGGSGGGNVYINAKWQVNVNGVYQAPWGIELAANVFGRQGYPFPLFRQGTTATMGADSGLQVLATPTVDYFRYPDLWDTDVRVARTFKMGGSATLRGMFDVFNVFNANTPLVRNNNLGSTAFNQLAQNLSPRVARVGIQIGF